MSSGKDSKGRELNIHGCISDSTHGALKTARNGHKTPDDIITNALRHYDTYGLDPATALDDM